MSRHDALLDSAAAHSVRESQAVEIANLQRTLKLADQINEAKSRQVDLLQEMARRSLADSRFFCFWAFAGWALLLALAIKGAM